VRVKKASSQQRVGADYNTRLEKGYFVKTGWDFSSVPGAAAYHLQVSASLIISNFLADKRKTDLMSVEISGLDEGTCYGTVSSMLNQITITARYGKRAKSAIRKTIMMEC
jgi:hypothetical protein